MAKRVLLAGLLGGIAMFVWSALAHLVLPLGQMGISEIPNEEQVLTAMQSSLGSSAGLYMFPGYGQGPAGQQPNMTMQQYEQKLATNPSGLLIYHPPGAKGMTPGKLGTEFLTELIEALLAAFLLAQTALRSYFARAGFVAAAGLMAGMTTNFPYWNWYGFPTRYTAAYMSIEVLSYVVAGLVAAALVKSSVQKV